MSGRTVADTAVLINFLCIDRMDLIGAHPDSFITTHSVAGEITNLGQKRRYMMSLANGFLVEESPLDSEPVEPKFEQPSDKVLLGIGERSAIAVAFDRGYRLATDDRDAINWAKREAERRGTSISIARTQDIIVELIECGALTVEEADVMRDEWARNHNFTLKIASFRELMP